MKTSTATMNYDDKIILALNNCDGQLSARRLAVMLGVSNSAVKNKECQARQALDRLVEKGRIAQVRGGYCLTEPTAAKTVALPPVGTSGPITEVLPMIGETIKTLYPILLPVYKAEMTKCTITEYGVELKVSASVSEDFKDKLYDGMDAVLNRVFGPAFLNYGLSIEYKSVVPAKKEEPKTSMTLAQELKSVLSRHFGATLGDMESFSVRLEGWKVMIEKDDPNAPKFFRQNNTGRRF